jgi:hypothetical protein
MSKKLSARNQVIKDEADAEVAYQAHLEQAKIHARNMAEDTARTEAQRVAAAEAETALHRVEEARKRAEQEQHPEAVTRTFWDWVKSFR